MRKKVFFYFLFLVFFLNNHIQAHEDNKLVQSRILGSITSLILPAPASVAISLIPLFEDDNESPELTKKNSDQNNTTTIFFNEQDANNTSINFINSLTYINSLE